MYVGLDFDNTLVSYDRLFHRLACEQGLIPLTIPCEKTEVRRHLRESGREDDWTRLQGQVYGDHILDAPPFPGMLDALRELADRQVPMCIVSHKTRAPYLGASSDLHVAARRWLERHGFHDPERLGWPPDRVFFELTKEEKVRRIVELQCTHYVDDLPEVLDMLPNRIRKILFAPSGHDGPSPAWRVMTAWDQLPRLLDA